MVDTGKSTFQNLFDGLELLTKVNLSKYLEQEEITELESALKTFIPKHIEWLEESLITLRDEEDINRESLSKLIGSIHNLSLDFEELKDLLIVLSDRVDNQLSNEILDEEETFGF